MGLVLRSFDKIGAAVAQLIEPSALARYRANAAALHNRAVFEIPEILEKIFERSRGATPANGSAVLLANSQKSTRGLSREIFTEATA